MPYEVPENYRAPKIDIFFAIMILVIIAALWFVSTKTAKAEGVPPPLPENPAAVMRLHPGGVLNLNPPTGPIDDGVEEDDAFARAAVVMAGEPAAAPAPVEEESEYEWYIPTWAKWAVTAVGGIAAVLVGKEAVDLVDLRDHARPPPTPAQAAAAQQAQAQIGGGATDADFVVTITGEFRGSPQTIMCSGQTKTFTPSLSFAPANPGAKGGRIDAYTSSQVCTPTVPLGSSSWTPGSEGEIVILCPDPFYLGRAALKGGVLVLASGASLSGGTILITPKAVVP